MNSTKKFLRATGYATMAFVTGSLAAEQDQASLFAVFSIAAGVCASGASCLTIAGYEELQYEREKFKDKHDDLDPLDPNSP